MLGSKPFLVHVKRPLAFEYGRGDKPLRMNVEIERRDLLHPLSKPTPIEAPWLELMARSSISPVPREPLPALAHLLPLPSTSTERQAEGSDCRRAIFIQEPDNIGDSVSLLSTRGWRAAGPTTSADIAGRRALSPIIALGRRWQIIEASVHRGAIAIKVDFGILGKGFFRSGNGASLVRRVKKRHVASFAVALPDDFVHLHAGLKLENHKPSLTGGLYRGRQPITLTSGSASGGHARCRSRSAAISNILVVFFAIGLAACRVTALASPNCELSSERPMVACHDECSGADTSRANIAGRRSAG